MTHFLEETGNIPLNMPKQARELAGIHALVVDATTKEHSSSLTSTNLRCYTRNCLGLIESEILSDTNDINWYCTEFDKEGFMSSWKVTKRDNFIMHQ